MPVFWPSGFAPAGFGYPEDSRSRSPGPVVLADELDTSADPAKRGELTSLMRGRTPVNAALAFQLGLKRDSGASVQGQGQDFAAVRKATEGAPLALENEARRLLRPFVQQALIEVERLTVGEPAGDMAGVTIDYRDLLAGGRGTTEG